MRRSNGRTSNEVRYARTIGTSRTTYPFENGDRALSFARGHLLWFLRIIFREFAQFIDHANKCLTQRRVSVQCRLRAFEQTFAGGGTRRGSRQHCCAVDQRSDVPSRACACALQRACMQLGPLPAHPQTPQNHHRRGLWAALLKK